MEKEKLELVGRAMWMVWSQIAGDLFECTGENEMDRNQVIEVVLDANRLESFTDGKVNEAVKEFVAKYNYEEMIAFAKTVFTSESYS